MKTKYFLNVILIGIITLLMTVPAKASTKTYNVPVEKEYTSAKFSIELPDDYEYEIDIESPDRKNTYHAIYTGDTTMECVINEELDKGEWHVFVKKEGEQIVIGQDGDGNDIYEDAPVEKVKITFEGSTEQLVDASKDIVVAEDIVGLKMYFKDDSFVAEWADTSCGDVNIEVVNEKNFQSLGKDTVTDNYYELPLDPATVQKIIVSVVPATSSGIEDAKKQYTYEFNNNPDAEVIYDDIEITNKDVINAQVVLRNNYSILTMCNNKEIERTETLAPGEYTMELPTEVGDNNFLIYIIDENGNMRSTAGYVFKDVVAPVLQMSREYVQISTQDEAIDIEGKVEDYDYFTINDAEVPVEGDHTFKYNYALKEGTNIIERVASDKAGNESRYTASIIRIIPQEEPIPWAKIIIICIVVVLIGLYIFDAVKKHYGGGGNDNRSSNHSKTTQTRKKESTSSEKRNGLIKDIVELLVPVVIIVIITNFVIGITVIQSSSMEPTLMTGNTVFVNRLCYKTGQDIKRGDIVVFNSKEFGKSFGKRVIGLPGDAIEFKNGYVVINGRYCDESAYISDNIETNCPKTFNVPDGCYFLLGDNRENSNDSRFWQNPYIPKEDIMGRYMGQLDFSFQYDVLGK